MNVWLVLIKQGESPPQELEFQELYTVTDAIFEKISGVKSPQPLAAEIPLPPLSDLKNKKRLLALDGINDPGNLGTLIRTALALGFEGLYLTEDSADLFNEKALRAAKGATFYLPYQRGSQQELWSLIETQGFHSYAGDLQGKNPSEISFSLPLILILGNEANGLSKLTKEKAELLTIPLVDQTESLNVGIAGGILMNKIKEQLEHGKNRWHLRLRRGFLLFR